MSSIEDQINEPVQGYDDDDYDVESATQEMLDQLTYRNCELLDENDRLKSEVERLNVEIKGLRDELDRYNPPSALRPPAGWVPMVSDSEETSR